MLMRSAVVHYNMPFKVPVRDSTHLGAHPWRPRKMTVVSWWIGRRVHRHHLPARGAKVPSIPGRTAALDLRGANDYKVEEERGSSVRNKLFLLVIVAVVVLGGLAIAWWYQEGGSVRVKGAEEYLLVLGLDDVGGSHRSDTILVAKLEANGVKVLSVPRDLRVKFPNGTLDKINAAYGQGGPELTRQLVSEALGLPLHGYAVVGYQGFTQFIDALGGVTVHIEKAMRYDDTKQNLHINLPAGTQTLNGAQALDYWRYRDAATGEDLGRIQRQQEFVKALAQKLAQVQGASQVKTLIEGTLPHLQTNLAAVDVYRLVERLKQLRPESLQLAILPGEPVTIDRVSYFRAEPIETAALVAEFFQGREVLTNKDVKVIVLNGHPDEVKRQGLAKRVSDLLRAQGFQIVAYWNADPFDYSESYLINVSGDTQKAERLATVLKMPLGAVTEAEFTAVTQEHFGEDRLAMIQRTLFATAVPPGNRRVELKEADLVIILGDGFLLAGGESN
jgi:LCP family protein required for cell wall assembly